MSTTYSLDHVSASVEDVSVETAAKSEMTLQSTTTDPKTGESVSKYVLPSGDNAYPATITYRSSVAKRSQGDVRNCSMTFSTWATSDDGLGTVVKKPLLASFNLQAPADMTIEVADADDLIGNAFSFLYLSVTAKVRDTTWLQKLLYGIPQVK